MRPASLGPRDDISVAGMDRSRILGAIAVTLLALGPASADPLQLSCSGTRTAQGGSAAPVTASAEIDIDNSKVRSSMGDMSIVRPPM